MEKKVLSVNELSKYLGIGMNAAYTLVHRSGFPSFQVGKRILIPISELEKWLAKEATGHNALA